MRQPAKKDFLSGDSRAFDSEGKSKCRQAWEKLSNGLYQTKGRKLNYLWLANNQLSDIDPILSSAASIIVPDNNDVNRAAKREVLKDQNGNLGKHALIRVVNSIDFTNNYDTFFDVINLDTCNHLDEDTLASINTLLKYQIEHTCYFFASFARWSMRGIQSKRFPQYRQLGSKLEDVHQILTKTFQNNNLQHRELEGFPLTYDTASKKTNLMYSFGWELTQA